MAITFRNVRQAARTTPGTQDFTVSGNGTPKFVLLTVTSATSGGTPTNTALLAMGMYDGTRQVTWSSRISDNRPAATAFSVWSSSYALLFKDVGGAAFAAATASFITDGVRLDWEAGPPSGYLVTAHIWWGSELTAYVNHATPSNTLDASVDITGPGVKPDFLFTFFSEVVLAEDTEIDGADLAFGFVRADGEKQVGSAYYTVNGIGDMDVRALVSTAYGCDPANSGTKALEFTDFDSSGFSVVTRRVGSSGGKLLYAALNFGGALDSWVGIVDSPTATGSYSVTGVPFKPIGYYSLFSFCDGVDSIKTTLATGAGSFNFGSTNASEGHNHCITDEDVIATSNTKSFEAAVAVGYLFAGEAPAIAHNASLTSFNDDGVTWNFSIANSAAVRKWPMVFFGPPPGDGNFMCLV